MNASELREACIEAGLKRYDTPIVDVIIRTVIDEVAGMLLGYAKQEHDAHELDGYRAFRNAALLVRHLLPSTDRTDNGGR